MLVTVGTIGLLLPGFPGAPFLFAGVFILVPGGPELLANSPYIHKGNTPEELARAAGIDVEGFTRTFNEWLALLRSGSEEDPATGRKLGKGGRTWTNVFSEEMVAHISRFAREIGTLEGEVRYGELVATQFAGLWHG